MPTYTCKFMVKKMTQYKSDCLCAFIAMQILWPLNFKVCVIPWHFYENDCFYNLNYVVNHVVWKFTHTQNQSLNFTGDVWDPPAYAFETSCHQSVSRSRIMIKVSDLLSLSCLRTKTKWIDEQDIHYSINSYVAIELAKPWSIT